jgi:2-polyprenyl-6-methoxyphenol hydroxylase-like FAD-dependent oxidoreductase
MTQTLDTPVLIAGGGPTGLVLASLLSQYGAGCVLAERNTHIASSGTTVADAADVIARMRGAQ